MDELKPCPFCGKPAKTSVDAKYGKITLRIYCEGPCVATQYEVVDEYCTFDEIYDAMEDVAYNWNRRADNG